MVKNDQINLLIEDLSEEVSGKMIKSDKGNIKFSVSGEYMHLPKKITIKLVWLCLKTFYQQKTFAFTIKDTQSSAAKHKNGKHDFFYRNNVARSFHKAIKPIRENSTRN